MRGLDELLPVAAEHSGAKVVSKDKDDVGFGLC